MVFGVFYGDSLVGELNSIETLCHLIMTNKVDTCTISVPSPFDIDESIDLSLEARKSTKHNVKIVNGSPYIKSNVYMTGRILTFDDNSNYIHNNNFSKIEQSANKYLTSQINSYLNKISKVYKSDIAGFGRYAKGNFLTVSQWNKYDWRSNFRNSFFDVNVDILLSSGYLIAET